MKTALTVLFLLTPLAYGQASEGTLTGAYIAPVPTHLRLLPKDFLTIRPQKLVIQDLLKSKFEDIKDNSWRVDYRLQDKTPARYQPLPPPSLEMTRTQLAVLCKTYHRLGAGGFGKRLWYSFKEEWIEEANCNNVSIFYRSQVGVLGSNSPLAKYYHDRETDVLGVLSRRVINIAKKGAVREFAPDGLLLLGHRLKKR